MSEILIPFIEDITPSVYKSTPGIRSMGLDVGATNNNLTISNNTMTPTNTPFAGYLLKSLTRLNLDRITFPKIYKPANTKCQVDVLSGLQSISSPTGSVFGLHFDGSTTDFVGSVSPESNTGTFDTTNKKFGSASIAYNGSNFTQYADSELWNVGSGNWYVEFQYRPTVLGTQHNICGQYDSSATNSTINFYVSKNSSDQIYVGVAVGGIGYVSGTLPISTANVWYHIRAGRNGNNLYIAVNGTVSTAGAFSGTINNSTNKFCIGQSGENTANRTVGNIDEFLFVKGVGMNTTNFTPPTGAYEIISSVTSQSVTFSSEASATTDFYKDDIFIVTSGPGAGQTRRITAYNGTTKVATLDQPWTTLPTTSSGLVLYDGIVSDISPGFDFSTIDYTVYPTVNVLCSLERLTGATASPSMGVPIVTSIERDWVSQAPVISTNATTAYTTVLNLTGRARLDMISSFTTAAGGIPWVRVTIDGTVVFNDLVVGLTGANSQLDFVMNREAQNSLLVEHRSAGAFSSSVAVSYSR